ncbi:hypothetical protein [Streptomyces hawaiiensis]|uniref:hypothetical protein n=1 Tax=Streptomyces hawaiiensis TaxID=67305 RepID=UPI00319DD6E2
MRRRNAFERVCQAVGEWSVKICQSSHKMPPEVGDVPRDAMTASRGQPGSAQPVQHYGER